ncbi:hypothetical protein [Brevibacillus thermoruber]|jgi:hypothetical protein|nr:hypothetical protein [Brevibacillus thermoruber]
MKKLMAIVAFAFLFTTSVLPATFSNQSGQNNLIKYYGAEPDWD